MASFDIVIFSKDKTCEYVPSSWAVYSTKKVYLWPKKLSIPQVRKLQDSCAEPSIAIGYEEWAAVCKRTVYSLKEAQKLAEKMTYTSNLSSDNTPLDDWDMEVSDGGTKRSNDELLLYKNTPKRFCREVDSNRNSKKSTFLLLNWCVTFFYFF